MLIINFYNNEDLCSVIYANSEEKTVSVKNFTNNLLFRAFGINEHPTWQDFESFLQSRCFPETRQNLKYDLKKLDLTEYNSLEICKKTNGKIFEDNQWMEIKDLDLELEEQYDRD